MKLQTECQEPVIRYRQGSITYEQDSIVTERPVTLVINGEEFVTLVCTPEYLEDLAIGFLASEGIIREAGDIRDLWIQEDEGYIHVSTDRWNDLQRSLYAKRYSTSCCGGGRLGYVYVNDARTAKIKDGIHVSLSFADIFRLMDKMQDGSELFHRTGGVHSAAVCDSRDIVLARCDIGRHNALDKIYGLCLRLQMVLSDKIIAFTGRISSEILLKAAKIGCEIILSKSAPTALALELARQLNMTTVGFIRQDSCNVYTGAERITDCEPAQVMTARLNNLLKE